MWKDWLGINSKRIVEWLKTAKNKIFKLVDFIYFVLNYSNRLMQLFHLTLYKGLTCFYFFLN